MSADPSDVIEVYLKDILSVDSHASSPTVGCIDLADDTKTYGVLVSYNNNECRRIQRFVENSVRASKPPEPDYDEYDEAPQGTQSQPSQSQASQILSQIEKLGELHEKGFLTDEEFNSTKTELLARL